MRETLETGLKLLEIPLEDTQIAQLCEFLERVLKQNEVMNLTAIRDPVQGAKLHLLDSLTLLKAADFRNKKVVDVGCGAGFPGVPLKIACPSAKLTLLDSLAKRMNWLSSVLPEMGIDAQICTARAEEAVRSRREQYDYAVSRAVARLPILLELTAPFVRVGGAVLAMKGSAAREELRESAAAMEQLGLKFEELREFPIEEGGHGVIVLRKVKHTPPKYPRRYAKIKQEPL